MKETISRIVDEISPAVVAERQAKIEKLELARMIDHTLLKPDVTKHELDKLCDEAKENSFYSVCVNSGNVPYCKSLLKGSSVKIASVIGFPLGASSTEIKAREAAKAVAEGADELDMVINIGWMKSGMTDEVYKDILAVVRAAHGLPVKVIIETGLLTDEEKVKACALAKEAGAAFVKTSTGFNQGGATVQDIELMRRTVGKQMGVKASGGVRSYEDAIRMINAGATRIGTSSGIAIINGKTGTSSY